MAIRMCWNRLPRNLLFQVRSASGRDEWKHTELFPEHRPKPDVEIPEIDEHDYVPEDKHRFDRPKEGIPTDWITFLTQPIDLRPKVIKNWFRRKAYENIVKQQSDVKNRRELYGSELGAAIFILELNGAIRFKGQTNWTRIKEEDRKKGVFPVLPLRGTIVEEIDATNTSLLYEGLDNFITLRGVKTLILSNCQYIDDWCLDKISGRLRNTLTKLVINDCPQITERGLAVLPRLRNLKTLHLSNLTKVNYLPLLCVLLEEGLPDCEVTGIEYIEGDIKENDDVISDASKITNRIDGKKDV